MNTISYIKTLSIFFLLLLITLCITPLIGSTDISLTRAFSTSLGNSNNIDAKVHYPIPIHLQKAAKFLKYKKGDFPIAEKIANTSISLPVHEYVTKKQLIHIANTINKFFKK